MATVYEEIVKYAGWSNDHTTTGWGLHGIFFDETPNLYSDKAASYLDSVSQTVKATPGILGDRMVSDYESSLVHQVALTTPTLLHRSSITQERSLTLGSPNLVLT
jgi:hypothetical protein